MDLHAKLKAVTAAAHRDIEQNSRLKSLLSDDLTCADYTHIIEKYYGYWLAFETRLREQSGIQTLVPDLIKRARAGLLEADLKNLGLKPNQISALPQPTLTRFEDSAQALGALYVMEGSTMGAALIKKHLKQLGTFEESQLNYFSDYGPEKIPMWKSFLRTLDAIKDEAAQNELVRSAQRTFASLDRWMQN